MRPASFADGLIDDLDVFDGVDGDGIVGDGLELDGTGDGADAVEISFCLDICSVLDQVELALAAAASCSDLIDLLLGGLVARVDLRGRA